MQDLLFLAHRIPYPPDKGDKIRSWHILKFLAERYRVHLGCFVDDPRDRRHQPYLESLCDECYFAPLGRVVGKYRSIRGLLAGQALTVAHYRDRGFAAWVSDLVKRRGVDRIFVFSSGLAPYAMDPVCSTATRVIDIIDVDSDKWRQYATTKPIWKRWIYRRESNLLLELERRAASIFDVSIFVSVHEANLFRSLAPDCAESIHHVDNGVDTSYFSPDLLYERPYFGEGKTIVFTGAMDYWPNVDAVDWFSKEIFPLIRQEQPSAQFFIVGANPSSAVCSLDRLPGIQVTGRVQDVRPYLAYADVAVAPLRVARGIQNKVLEAMAMAKPVVATPEAVEGIRASPEKELSLASDANAFATATLALLDGTDGRQMGDLARARVIRDYGWENSLHRIRKFLEGSNAEDATPVTSTASSAG